MRQQKNRDFPEKIAVVMNEDVSGQSVMAVAVISRNAVLLASSWAG
jgi:hypothetical protein